LSHSSLHHGGEGMLEQRSLRHGSQEAEKRMRALMDSSFPFFFQLGSPAYGMVPPIFRAGLPPLVIPLWKALTDAPRGVLY
jgi:hypothetical protein